MEADHRAEDLSVEGYWVQTLFAVDLQVAGLLVHHRGATHSEACQHLVSLVQGFLVMTHSS